MQFSERKFAFFGAYKDVNDLSVNDMSLNKKHVQNLIIIFDDFYLGSNMKIARSFRNCTEMIKK